MERKDYRLAAILYTNIAGFSRMMEKDEAATLQALHFHNALITEAAGRWHGTVIKTIGDVFLVDFRNTVEALQTALDIQNKLYQYNLEHNDQRLLVRIGIHLGDIYFFENDALGEGINIAARLQALAHPGGICISGDVYNQVINKLDFHAVELGKVSLKNITKEIQAYEISSANAEFDPDRGINRSDLPPEANTTGRGRDHSTESSANTLAEIRSAILADTKSEGRRLSVDEALTRYGSYGVEAQEVIARMADQGLLTKRKPSYSGAEENTRTASEGKFDGEALGRDIERAVRGIFTLVENKIGEYEENHRPSRDGRPDRQDERRRGRDRMEYRMERAAERMEERFGRWNEKAAVKAELKRHVSETETGEWDKELKDSDYFKPGREELASSFEEYRSGLTDKARKLRGGFLGHLISFVGVNALLWFMNLNMHMGPSVLWAAAVTAGWGTGLVSNLAGILRANAKGREEERIPDLERDALATYKKLNIVRDSMARHTASVLTVPVLLFTIYTLFTPMIFPWWIIPSGIMAISWISHLAAYGSARRRLETKLFKQMNAPGGWRDLFRFGRTRKATTSAAGPCASLYAQAEAAKEAIAAQVRAAGKDSPFDKDLVPSLEEYVGQVRLLTQTVNEIDSIIDTIPMKDLEKDKADLKRKMETPAGESLRAEYIRSVEEIEKQERSFKDLQDQREVLHLRLKSSVNTLKQMQLDIARFRAQPDAAQAASLDQIRSKTGELSRYMEDLRKGYEEARDVEDPWKDLEKIAREREMKTRAAKKNPPASSKAGDASDA